MLIFSLHDLKEYDFRMQFQFIKTNVVGKPHVLWESLVSCKYIQFYDRNLSRFLSFALICMNKTLYAFSSIV